MKTKVLDFIKQHWEVLAVALTAFLGGLLHGLPGFIALVFCGAFITLATERPTL